MVTAVLLLLSLPVLAGMPYNIVPALNLAVCGELSMSCMILMPIFTRDNPQVMYRNFTSGQNLNDCAPGLLNPLSYSRITIASYLAGLLEGDGTIVVPTTERSPKGKLNYPSVQISFAAKDYPLITLLRFVLGYGSISKRKMQAAYIYTINDRAGISAFVNLLNGLLRTPKIEDFNNLALYLGIVPMGIDTSCLSSNA